MSRIGNKPIVVPEDVTVNISDDNLITVKGPKGELEQQIDADLEVKLEDGELNFSRPTEQKRHKSMHGLYRSLVNNMVVGVKEGYQKQLEFLGVCYKASDQGNML